VRIRRAAHEVDEDQRWIVPKIEWDRSLDPSVDQELISAMSNISSAFPQVQFSPSSLMATVNRDFEEEQKQRVKDYEVQQKILKDHPELMAPAAAGPGGGGGGGGGAMMPGLPAESFGEELGGEPPAEGTEAPPEGASLEAAGGDTADRSGPRDPHDDNWDHDGRFGQWSKHELRDLVEMFEGYEPEDDPWIRAWRDADIRFAFGGDDEDEKWEALEQWLLDSDYPSRVIAQLQDALIRLKVLKPNNPYRAAVEKVRHRQLFKNTGESTEPGLLRGAP
jgi:hypothetical protein